MNAKNGHRLLVTISLLCVFILSGCASAGYIRRAYFFPGSSTSLRGYPTIDPPDGYSGTWTHYTYTGRPLAFLQYRNGDSDGRQVYLDDSRQPYLIRYIRDGRYHHDELRRPCPQFASVPWIFPQRWIHPERFRPLMPQSPPAIPK